MTTNTFERINYLTRSNKSIERKIIFETLVKLRPLANFALYRYIGFGSMWFVDFLFAHRLLNIEDMWSIEYLENADRADFNRPYRSITVKGGQSGVVLSQMTPDEWSVPTVAWLDYTAPLNPEIVADIRKLSVNLAPNSFVLLTVNASRKSYRVNDPSATQGDGRKIPSFDTVASLLGSQSVSTSFLSVTDIRGKLIEVREEDFQLFLADSLHRFLAHVVVAAGRTDGATAVDFLPMFNFSHRDGVDMVTVGGVLAAPAQTEALRRIIQELCNWDNAGRPSHMRLDLVELTLKEKATLDRLLPNVIGEDFVQVSKTAGIKLPDEQIAKYQECYRHFPVFVESLM